MSLIKSLFDRPASLSIASKYTVANGTLYLGCGALFIAWPGVIQTVLWTRPSWDTRRR